MATKSIKDTAQDRLFAEAKRQNKLSTKDKKAVTKNYGYATKTKMDEARARTKSAKSTGSYINEKLGEEVE